MSKCNDCLCYDSERKICMKSGEPLTSNPDEDCSCSGYVELAKEPVCKTCGGSGTVDTVSTLSGLDTLTERDIPCPRCKGTGIEPDCQEPEPKTERKCEDCEFWKENEINPLIAVQQATKRWGECRRYAPRLVMAGNSVDIECDKDWAGTNPDDWCGEFKPKEG